MPCAMKSWTDKDIFYEPCVYAGFNETGKKIGNTTESYASCSRTQNYRGMDGDLWRGSWCESDIRSFIHGSKVQR